MHDLEFRSWRRVTDLSAGSLDRARHEEKVMVSGGAESREATITFEFPGPGDVAARASAVIRCYPTDGAAATEASLCAHVEFVDADFPWRYAPYATTPGSWLSILVGVEDADLSLVNTDAGLAVRLLRSELATEAEQTATIGAHVQYRVENETAVGAPLGRLVSMTKLPPNAHCLAAVVPAVPSPEDKANGIRPAYFTWRFITGDGEDFRSIASRLRLHEQADLGQAELQLPSGFGPSVTLASALRGLPPQGEAAAPIAVPDAATLVAVEALTDPSSAGGNARPVIGLPVYTEPWPVPADAVFAEQLLTDPRDRGVAGLGAIDAIEDQAHLVGAMLDQSGHLGLARKRIGAMAAGIAVSIGLWRRLPEDPVARLAVLGPAVRGLRQDSGVDVAAAIEGMSPFPISVMSSAARRHVRRRRRSGVALDPAQLLRAAADRPAAIDIDPNPEGFTNADLADADAARRWLFPDDSPQATPAPLGQERLERLAAELATLFDPTGSNAPQRQRVLATITGLEHDPEPTQLPDACESLDLPAWRYLAERHREFLLFGSGEIPPDSVVPLEVNDRFVDAYLVGLNAQLLAELRFRNVAIAPGCTPVRRFWSQIRSATEAQPRPHDDIREIGSWPVTSSLGDPAHEPPEPALGAVAKDELVVMFRTTLFQRYPDTIVSLRKAGTPERLAPIFGGQLATDIQFFGFQVPASALSQYDVVLEDPPHLVRFRHDPAVVEQTTSSAWASTHLDQPIQVVIAGSYLRGT